MSAPITLPATPYAANCPSRQILDRIGDRWTALVMLLLADRAQRFSELARAIEGISPKVLTATLRGLERDGLATRTVFAEVPPRVEYELTPLGRTLIDAVQALHTWAVTHIDAIETARAAYDASTVRKGRTGAAGAGRERTDPHVRR